MKPDPCKEVFNQVIITLQSSIIPFTYKTKCVHSYTNNTIDIDT